jgi:hypothetical protein
MDGSKLWGALTKLLNGDEVTRFDGCFVTFSRIWTVYKFIRIALIRCYNTGTANVQRDRLRRWLFLKISKIISVLSVNTKYADVFRILNN